MAWIRTLQLCKRVRFPRQDDRIAVKSRQERGRKACGESHRSTSGLRTVPLPAASAWRWKRNVGRHPGPFAEDCVFSDVYSIGSIKTPGQRRGGKILYMKPAASEFKPHEHQDCIGSAGAIYVDEFYSHDTFDTEHPEPVDEGTSVIRNIL